MKENDPVPNLQKDFQKRLEKETGLSAEQTRLRLSEPLRLLTNQVLSRQQQTPQLVRPQSMPIYSEANQRAESFPETNKKTAEGGGTLPKYEGIALQNGILVYVDNYGIVKDEV